MAHCTVVVALTIIGAEPIGPDVPIGTVLILPHSQIREIKAGMRIYAAN